MNSSKLHSIQNRRRVSLRLALITGLLAVVPSCRIPELKRADKAPVMPISFNQASIDDGLDSYENSGRVDLHEFFNDPTLTSLIDESLVGNQELKILAQDIAIANNEVLARRGAYFPFVTLGTGASLEKSSVFSREGAVENSLSVNGGSIPDPYPNFLVATNVSWEIDIWKKLRNARSAAALRYLGTAEGRNYVVTRMVAEISESYYELLALDKRLETLDKTIQLQEQMLDYTSKLVDAGQATEFPVQRFQAEVRKNQSEKLIIKQEIVEVENRINFLAGRYPQVVERMSGQEFDDFIALQLPLLRLGVPPQLLQNRPDIRQRERELAAAGLEVRVARARFYPSVFINGGVGYRAFNDKYLFSTPDSLIYNIGGDLVAPLINRAAIKADYMTANAKQLQCCYNYQRTILNAFTEVINRITKVENYSRSLEIKKQQLASLESAVTSATALFKAGQVDYIEVLLAQRDMMEAKMVLINTKKQQLSAIVNTYQALGGGLSFNVGTPTAPVPVNP